MRRPDLALSPVLMRHSLIRRGDFAVISRKFPVPWLREFDRKKQGLIPFPRLNSHKFPVFSRKTGKYESETGSPMTASTAKIAINNLSCKAFFLA